MGTIIGIFYIPIFILLCFLTALIYKKFKVKDCSFSLSTLNNILAVVVGAIINILITVLIVKSIQVKEGWESEGFVIQVLVSLVVPFVLGFIFAISTQYLFKLRPLNFKLFYISRIGIGSLHAFWILPIAVLLSSFTQFVANEHQIKSSKEYIEKISHVEDLCQSNRIQIFKTVDNAKSIYFSKGRLSTNETWLLWNRELDFIEARHKKKGGGFVLKKTVKDLSPPKKGASQVPVISTTIDRPQSRFEVYYNDVTNDSDKQNNARVKELIINDRQNEEILATSSHVYGLRECPPKELSDIKLISYTLGIATKDGKRKFEKALAKYHKSKKLIQ